MPRPCQSSATSNATPRAAGPARGCTRRGRPSAPARRRRRPGRAPLRRSAAMYEAARWTSAPALKKRSQRDSTDSRRGRRSARLVLRHHRADADGGAVAQRDVDGGGEKGHGATVRPKEADSIRPPPRCHCVVRREDPASRASRASRRAASTSSRGRSVRTSMPWISPSGCHSSAWRTATSGPASETRSASSSARRPAARAPRRGRGTRAMRARRRRAPRGTPRGRPGSGTSHRRPRARRRRPARVRRPSAS